MMSRHLRPKVPILPRTAPRSAISRLTHQAAERMTIAGYVLAQNCKPVGRALVELWHADQTGTYDNSGFKLRGHQFTDAEGRWRFDTIVPGLYPGRTRHYHLKAQRLGGSLLTT